MDDNLRKYDWLTGLLTEEYFVELAEDMLRNEHTRGNRPVIVSFDFIGMKGFNNKYGRAEGDVLFRAFARLLEQYFPMGRIARFYEDHFYTYTEAELVEDIINHLIIDLNTLNDGKTLPVKIGICEYDPGIDIPTLCDWARIASESRRTVYASNYAWFDEQLYAEYDMREYILTHLDDAIKNHYLQVYYQPIVRNLTGRLASYEALVRWIDPDRGMISPAVFIPILEENGVSYKVDRYVVNEVAWLIRQDMIAGKPCVPFSINISRADFDAIDPVEMVISQIDNYEIPRHYITVEITETALANDDGIISYAIERFHEAGLNVWMDDFGSGYSSLNILKSFDFDGLKIDMDFLRNFDERSKDIINMSVQMAKKLGIHTVAEGVETAEHLQFLKEIGCEKIQGYYYGRPLPLADAMNNIVSRGIIMESAEDASFYDELGLMEMVNNMPSALFSYDGYDFELQFRNIKYIEECCFGDENAVDDLEWSMNSAASGTGRKYRALAERSISSGETETMNIVFNEKYYNFSFRCLARHSSSVMLEATLERLNYEEKGRLEFIDIAARNFVTFFDTIYLSDMDNDTLQVLINNFAPEAMGTEITDVNDFYNTYVTRYIYYDDMDRFAKFASKKDILSRLRDSENGYYSNLFRIRAADGSYRWSEFFVIALPEPEKRRILICTKPTSATSQLDKYNNIKCMLGDNASAADHETIAAELVRANVYNILKEDENVADEIKESVTNRTLRSIISMLSNLENIIGLDETINGALQQIGELIEADRTYIIQTDRHTLSETYEWYREGVRPAIEGKQNKSYSYMVPFEHLAEMGSCIRMDDVYSLRMHYLKAYNHLRAYNVDRFILVPLYIDGAFVGYLGADNYAINCRVDVQNILETMSKFISAKFMKGYMYQRRSAQSETVQHSFTSEKVVAEEMSRRISIILESNLEYHDAMEHALSALAEEISADKISVMEIEGDTISVSFEHCADGVTSEIKALQHLNYSSYVNSWEKMLDDDNRCIVVEDTEVYKNTNPVAYISLKRFGVNNLIAVPFYSNGRLRGYLRVDNYRLKEYYKTREILIATGYIIGARVNNYYYQRINSFDDLTGVHNRNAMTLRVAKLRQSARPLGIVYADLNGLKEINDKKGHEAGDRFIKNSANVLAEIFGSEDIFRTGGDEFMIFCTDITRDEFDQLQAELKERLSSPLAPNMSVGCIWCNNSEQINDAIKEADAEMYEDKRKYYLTHERYRG